MCVTRRPVSILAAEIRSARAQSEHLCSQVGALSRPLIGTARQPDAFASCHDSKKSRGADPRPRLGGDHTSPQASQENSKPSVVRVGVKTGVAEPGKHDLALAVPPELSRLREILIIVQPVVLARRTDQDFGHPIVAAVATSLAIRLAGGMVGWRFAVLWRGYRSVSAAVAARFRLDLSNCFFQRNPRN